MTIDKAEKIIKDHLLARRLAHSFRVAEVASDLASAYGFDSDRAEIAGLLHDFAKEFSREELLQLGERYQLSANFTKHPHLLHGPVAAYYLKEYYAVHDDEILEAIAFHTVGKAGMGPLAQIVYVADYIEPGRRYINFEEVNKCRDKGLDELTFYVVSQTVKYLKKQEAFIHPNACQLYDTLMKNR